MTTGSWKFVFSSSVGTSHIGTATPCQDSSTCEVLDERDGSQVLIAIVADGAGSAKCAEIGSALACTYFIQVIKAYLAAGGSLPEIDAEVVKNWLVGFQSEVIAKCADNDLLPRDFASTVLTAIIGNDCAVFFQIGDGAIVITDCEEPDNYRWVFWPQQGQYANETNFATDEHAPEKIEFTLVSRRIDEVAAFSDGLQGLTLHYESRQAHNPFFAPIFGWLRAAPESNSQKHTASLTSFLNSEKINDGTDDDKTIVLATRRNVVADQDPLKCNHDDQDEIASL